MSEKFELRSVFNAKTVKQTAQQIKEVYPIFHDSAFVTSTLDGFELLSFGDRNSKITDNLYTYLPQAFPVAVEILVEALGEEMQVEVLEGYEGFYVLPLSTYVSRYGQNDYERSIEALIEMTKRFTSEWSIRIFLEHEQTKTLQHLHRCTQSDNCHVRRLASEGSRPRLPLGSRLHAFIQKPQLVLDLLEALKNEPTRLVQRSIANNLNDIAKDNPDDVVSFLKHWKAEGVKDVDWIIKHATRTLVKEGHFGALELLGFDVDIAIERVSVEVITPKVILGETLEFVTKINFNNPKKSKVVIDYLLHFKKANGSLKPKVFKLSTKEISSHASLSLTKRHPLKPATTRSYYEGLQAIQLQINGKIATELIPFELLV